MPLTARSNKSLQKYFSSFEAALAGMKAVEDLGGKFDRTKHGSLFLSVVLTRVVPHLDQRDRVLPYLVELGALHQREGVARHHLDLLGLAYCSAIRGVVQGGGMRGGLLHETTKAWIGLVLAICHAMKSGYKSVEQADQGRGEIEGKNGEKNKKEEDFLEGVERVEWKCPVRPRSLNFGQRSRVLRFRRQQSHHHFEETSTSSFDSSAKMKKLFKMSR